MECYPRTFKLTHRVYAANVHLKRSPNIRIQDGVASQTTANLLTQPQEPIQSEGNTNISAGLGEYQWKEAKTARKHARSGSMGNSPSQIHQEEFTPLENKQRWSESLYRSTSAAEEDTQRIAKLKEVLQQLTSQEQQLLSRLKLQEQQKESELQHEYSIKEQFCREIDRIEQLTNRIARLR